LLINQRRSNHSRGERFTWTRCKCSLTTIGA